MALLDSLYCHGRSSYWKLFSVYRIEQCCDCTVLPPLERSCATKVAQRAPVSALESGLLDVASPPYAPSVLPRCRPPSTLYRLYWKADVAIRLPADLRIDIDKWRKAPARSAVALRGREPCTMLPNTLPNLFSAIANRQETETREGSVAAILYTLYQQTKG